MRDWWWTIWPPHDIAEYHTLYWDAFRTGSDFLWLTMRKKWQALSETHRAHLMRRGLQP